LLYTLCIQLNNLEVFKTKVFQLPSDNPYWNPMFQTGKNYEKHNIYEDGALSDTLKHFGQLFVCSVCTSLTVIPNLALALHTQRLVVMPVGDSARCNGWRKMYAKYKQTTEQNASVENNGITTPSHLLFLQ